MLPLLLAGLIAATATTETDISLADALETALRSSPLRTEADAARLESAVRLGRGINALLPSVTGNLSYGSSTTPNPLRPETSLTVEGWTGTLNIGQVVFDPQVFGAVVSAFCYSGYHAAEAQDKNARLVLDVITDYLGLLNARLMRTAAAEALVRAEDNLNFVREKERLGSASRLDVLRSAAFRSQAQVTLAAADKAQAAANAALLATLGLTGEMTLNPTEELAEPPVLDTSDFAGLLAAVERCNPGARLVRSADAAARAGVVAAAGQALPGVSAYWSSSYSDSSLPRSITRWRESDDISWGVRLSFPLLDIKSYLLNLADAGVQARRARAATRRTLLQLRSAAVAAVLGYREARLQLDYARNNLELNEELYRLARDQHRLGSLSLLDLFSVETGLTQARNSYTSALAQTWIQAAQVNYLLGIAALPR
uniref:TolC family protein n=1 Tax=candidate division WOR-3 bacterium TaxID=2052148 RepID=A0A7C4GF37_UNCW3